MAQPFDPSAVDCDAFFRDLRAIRREVETSYGEEDVAHVRFIERFGRASTALGLATAWFPNPLSMAALAFGRSTSWLLMHHVGHRGYDRVPGIPEHLTSRGFAAGRRRFLDWPDWMLPEAWKYEHNVLHHTNTGELKDPDLIERNTEVLRDMRAPAAFKYGVMGLLAMTWRASYYAPTTIRVWLQRGTDLTGEENPPGYFKTLLLHCYAPYALFQFVALPALFAPLGPLAMASALVNSLGAEAITNVHTFLVVGPNHTGDDLYRFDEPARSHAEAAVRQVLGSVNYATGSELVDYAHLYLNYQVEHHLFPDIPMARYRQIQPKIEALCAKHGIPYVKESVWSRARKMLSVAVGKTSMKRVRNVGEKALGRARAGLSAA
ncbi:MAG: fatty acid desaturase [Labilithrix sp.]|nr:fatty acid desaturase [Labilithrix sp.]MCW5811022.1 fatty acid desaturase [Labilithrix sp.]